MKALKSSTASIVNRLCPEFALEEYSQPRRHILNTVQNISSLGQVLVYIIAPK